MVYVIQNHAGISCFANLDRCLERHFLVNVLEEKRLYFRGTKNMHARFHICVYTIYIYILKNRVYSRVRVYACAQESIRSVPEHKTPLWGKNSFSEKWRDIIIFNNSDTDYRLVSSVFLFAARRLPRKRFKEFSTDALRE